MNGLDFWIELQTLMREGLAREQWDVEYRALCDKYREFLPDSPLYYGPSTFGEDKFLSTSPSPQMPMRD